MYIEFLLLIFDYFSTLNKRNFYFEWLIPFVFSILIFFSIRFNNSAVCFDDYRGNIISLIGVLIGFSITALTLLITSNNSNIESLKKENTPYFIGKKQVNLFDLLVINFSYLIIAEIFLIISNLFFPAFNAFIQISFTAKLILFSFNCFLIIHVLLLNLRNICDLYFTLIGHIKIDNKK